MTPGMLLVVRLIPLALLLAFVPAASATVVLPADFAEVVSGAETIVYGRVVDVRSTLSGPRRVIESFVTVSVIESLKGAPGFEGVAAERVTDFLYDDRGRPVHANLGAHPPLAIPQEDDPDDRT